MQGKKTYTPKLFNSFNLADRIPENNFYRQLKSVLDLKFLYKDTQAYYGSCGQKSLDPTVFFKLISDFRFNNFVHEFRFYLFQKFNYQSTVIEAWKK